MASSAWGIRLLARPGVQLMVLATLAVVVLAFRGLQFAVLSGQEQWGYDFTFYWTAARHLIEGDPIYSAAQLAGPYAPQGQEGFLYPPAAAILALPLAALFPSDARAAAWVWAALGALILVASVLAVARSGRIAERFQILGGRGRWLLVAAAFALPPVVGELVMGNVHLLLLGLLTLAWWGIRRGDDRGEWLAGLAVGAAALVKVFPGLLLLWFLLSRRWRASAGVLVAIVALTLLTLPITGLEAWRQYPTVLANLSAPADTTDTLAPTVWLAPYLGFDVARVVVAAIGVLLVLAFGAVARRDRPAVLPAVVDRSFGAAVLLSVLVAPALYHHYLALAVLPLLLALAAWVPLPWVALAYFLMWGGQQDALGDYAWIVNRAMPTLGALVLLAVLAPWLGDRRRAARPIARMSSA